MIYKVLVGDEHGGTATSSSEIINAFLDKDENFKVIFLTKGRFSENFSSDNIATLSSGCPPIIQSKSKIKVILNYINFLIWVINASLNLSRFIKHNKVKNIHTTNNHALLVCLLCKIFTPDLYIISHWRSVGLTNSSKFQMLFGKIDKVIAISHAVKESLPDILQLKACVIYNGIDIERIYTTNISNKGKLRHLLNISDTTFLTGTIGSYTPIKCHDLIIDAMVLSENKDYVVALMGSAPNVESEKYLSYLKDKVSKNKLENRIFFIDDSVIKKPNEYISDFDLFVGATWNNGAGEGFGLVYVEAMAALLPVVAIDVGAAKEVISDKNTGFLIKENSPVELNAVITREINNPELKNMQNVIRERSKMFDISITINNIKQVYDTLK